MKKKENIIVISIDTDQDFWVRYDNKVLPKNIETHNSVLYIQGDIDTLDKKLADLAYIKQLEFGNLTVGEAMNQEIQSFYNNYKFGKEQYLYNNFGNYSIGILECSLDNIKRLML